MAENAALTPPSLPIGSFGRIGLGWWGLVCFITTEAALFGSLLFSYGYYAVQSPKTWLPDAHPSFRFALPLVIIAILSSLAVWWGERGVKRDSRRQLLVGFWLALLLGLIFIAVELMDWHDKGFSLSSSLYGSAYFVITGLHLAHVIAGVVALLVVSFWSALGYFDRRRHGPVVITAAYWHFVNAVWLVFFVAFYVTPYLG